MPGMEARARSHRDQQRVAGIAERLAGDAPDLRKRGRDLRLERWRIGHRAVVVVGADLGGDGESGRHRQAEIGHLREARALAAEQVAHVGAAFRGAVAETVDPFRRRADREDAWPGAVDALRPADLGRARWSGPPEWKRRGLLLLFHGLDVTWTLPLTHTPGAQVSAASAAAR